MFYAFFLTIFFRIFQAERIFPRIGSSTIYLDLFPNFFVLMRSFIFWFWDFTRRAQIISNYWVKSHESFFSFFMKSQYNKIHRLICFSNHVTETGGDRKMGFRYVILNERGFLRGENWRGVVAPLSKSPRINKICDTMKTYFAFEYCFSKKFCSRSTNFFFFHFDNDMNKQFFLESWAEN